MERYARIIQECQHDLGLEVSSFDYVRMSAVKLSVGNSTEER
jgi:hypothetical protein